MLDRKRRKPLIIIVLVVVLVVAVLLIFHWLSASSQASNTTNAPKLSASKPVGNQTFTGAYMSFTYSGQYIAQQLTAQAPDLESYMLSADTSYPKNLAVTVTTGDMTKSSGYNLRQIDTADYSRHSELVDGSQAVLWVKADGSEQTAYIQHGPNFATLSFNVQNTNVSSLTAEVNAVLASFHWLQ